MGETTGIGWTDHTFNPWMGCTRVSPACDHCYAEALMKRTGRARWGDDEPRVVTSDAYWRNPAKWDAKAAAGEPGPNTGRARHLVFCASLADVYEDRPDLAEPRARLFDLIASTPNLDWLLLTKRPQNVLRLAPAAWLGADEHGMVQVDPTHRVPARYVTDDERRALLAERWPANVWIGTTVEDQERADERIPHLLDVPGPVRFLSCEPLLGPIDLRPYLRRIAPEAEAASSFSWDTSRRIDWLIVGGESGAGHRPLDLDHARAIRDEAGVWGVPLFFKQVGGQYPTSGGDLLDGERIKNFPEPTGRRG